MPQDPGWLSRVSNSVRAAVFGPRHSLVTASIQPPQHSRAYRSMYNRCTAFRSLYSTGCVLVQQVYSLQLLLLFIKRVHRILLCNISLYSRSPSHPRCLLIIPLPAPQVPNITLERLIPFPVREVPILPPRPILIQPSAPTAPCEVGTQPPAQTDTYSAFSSYRSL